MIFWIISGITILIVGMYFAYQNGYDNAWQESKEAHKLPEEKIAKLDITHLQVVMRMCIKNSEAMNILAHEYLRTDKILSAFKVIEISENNLNNLFQYIKELEDTKVLSTKHTPAHNTVEFEIQRTILRLKRLRTLTEKLSNRVKYNAT